eukprot:Rmarinus@m.17188
MASSAAPASPTKKAFQPMVFRGRYRRQKEKDRLKLSAPDYLKRYHIFLYLRDCIRLLAECRDEQPLAFVSKYFSSVLRGDHVLLREFSYVNATPHNRCCFLHAFKYAYSGLSIAAMTFSDYYQLICLLCPDFSISPIEEAAKCLTDGSLRNEVSFDQFFPLFEILVFFSEFVTQAGHIFRKCDDVPMGMVRPVQFWDSVHSTLYKSPQPYSCPPVEVVYKVLLRATDAAKRDVPSLTFNDFCLGLCTHASSIIPASCVRKSRLSTVRQSESEQRRAKALLREWAKADTTTLNNE